MSEDTNTSLGLKRLGEVAAMLMIGDGLIGMIQPERHIPLWRSGFPPLKAVVDRFDGEPLMRRRLAGAAQVAIGLAMAAPLRRRG